jgi:serine/threonine protein kinase
MTERFTLLLELGRGGMGVVWKARDEETGQIVALKLLRETYAEDPDYVTRFERELELAKRIDSIHVVKVLGFGVRAKIPYLALEYVDGPSLHGALSAHGPYDWPESRSILAQIAQGLADANAAGVVHRDVKPSNVLIGPDGAAKLTDFGIARGLDLTRFTATSTVLGTPAYLAPEGPKDARSDLYSLGIIGYELLTGAVPFKGTSYQEVIVEHIRTAPDLEKLPREARKIIGWLLAKNPAKRPQSAGELLAALGGSQRAPALAIAGAAPAALAASGRTSIIRPPTGRHMSSASLARPLRVRSRRATLLVGGFVALALAFASGMTLLAVLPGGATPTASVVRSDVGGLAVTGSPDLSGTSGPTEGPADSVVSSVGAATSPSAGPAPTTSGTAPSATTPPVTAPPAPGITAPPVTAPPAPGITAPPVTAPPVTPAPPTLPPVTAPPVTAPPVTPVPVTPPPVTPVPVTQPPYSIVAPPAATTTYASLSSGAYHTCAIKTNGSIACWGDNTYGQSRPPAGTFTQVMAGANHNCAINSGGSIACWGDNRYGQANAPSGSFTWVYPGDRHTCAINAGGTIVCWGDNTYGQLNVPAGTYTNLTAGGSHACATKTYGTIVCWGDNTYGQNNVPSGVLGAVRAAPQHTCAIAAGGSMVCWGNSAYRQTTPPSIDFSDVGRGAEHTCGLTSGGIVGCWGRNDYGQAVAPSGTFYRLGGGWYHTCAIKSADKTMVCWGLNDHGQSPKFV